MTDCELEDEEPQQFNVYRNGRIYVCREMCATCVFRPGNVMRLERGRLAGMVRDATSSESTIVCHSTLYQEGVDNAVCFGFFDRHATQPLQVAQRLGIIEFVDPNPAKGAP